MGIINRMRRQTGLYWGPPSPDGNGGFAFPDPVEIDCRWEELYGLSQDPVSHVEIPSATVYVDRDVEVNGYLLLGDLESGQEGTDPQDLPEARLIKGFRKIPNLRATEFLRIATV